MLKISERQISVSSAIIGFKNFSGEKTKYNKKGDKNFCLFLDNEDADVLFERGFNVKFPLLENGERDYDRRPYVKVNVKFDNIPPKVVTINGSVTTILSEEEVSILDHADIENIDLVLSTYNWEVDGDKGVSLYLKNMYVTLVYDEFVEKYGV